MAVLRWLDKRFEYSLLALLLGTMTALSFVNVILRYGYSSSIVWSDEVCRYCLVLSGFFSIPCWVRYNTGLRVDALLVCLPESVRKFLDYLVNVFMVFFFLYLFDGAWIVVRNALAINLRSPVLRFPMAYLYGLVAFAFALSIVRLLQMLTLQVRTDFGKDSKGGVKEGKFA